MKKLFLTIFLLFCISFFAQIGNVCINYSITIQDDTTDFELNSDYRRMFEKSFGTSTSVEFELVASKLESKFNKVSKVSFQDSKSTDMLVEASASYDGVTFQFKDNIFIKDEQLIPVVFEKSSLKESWILTNESKQIDRFVCYKATNIKVVNNATGVFKHRVIAWYCPQIPIKSGPNGYGNLPGLILELQVRNAVYGATKIDLNCNKKLDNSFLSDVKTISNEERMEMYRKMD